MVISCVISCINSYFIGHYDLSQFSVRIILKPRYFVLKKFSPIANPLLALTITISTGTHQEEPYAA